MKKKTPISRGTPIYPEGCPRRVYLGDYEAKIYTPLGTIVIPKPTLRKGKLVQDIAILPGGVRHYYVVPATGRTLKRGGFRLKAK